LRSAASSFLRSASSVITGILGLAALMVLAINGAFEGEIAIAVVSALPSMSCTIWASPASSEVEAGPV